LSTTELLILKFGGGVATRPLPRGGGVEELHGNPTVVSEVKNGRSGA